MIIRGFTTCSIVRYMVLKERCGFYAFETWPYAEATLSSNNVSHQGVHNLHPAKDSLGEIKTLRLWCTIIKECLIQNGDLYAEDG